MLRRLRGKTKGFTLIELLIVVAIIGILAAIAIPNLLAAQRRARVSRALADTRQIVSQAQLYNNDFNAFPTLFQLTGRAPLPDGTTRGYVSQVFDPFGSTAIQDYGYGTAGPIWALSEGPPGGTGTAPPGPRLVGGPSSPTCAGVVGFQTDFGAIDVTGC